MEEKKAKNTGQPNQATEYKTRLERLAKIRQSGVEPYPSVCQRSLSLDEVLARFDQLKNEVTVIGRIRSIRLHGGSCFAHLEDESGKMQAYFKRDETGLEPYKFFTQTIDVGDFIQVSGSPFTTKRGEKSLLVKTFRMLTKSLLPLPEKWHGLADVETRFRKRYLDLLSNPEVKEIFKKRSRIIRFIRDYFQNDGFMEVDTPILQAVASGAIARPFKTHHNALNADMYLRVAPELYLKELVIGGYEKVFEIARCFRNEGIDYAHNPEFTQIEFYWAYQDYAGLMAYMEKFMARLVEEICGSTKVEYDGQTVDFAGPYARVDFRQALLEEIKIDLDEHDAASLAKEARERGLKVGRGWGKGKLADELYKKFVRPKLINPTYIINHPLELSPLAKKIKDRPNYVERFQLIVGGRIELMNAFSELNDAVDQAERFKFQQELAGQGDDEAMGKDDEFVEALKYGLPPTAGLGMGIDRLVNILTQTHNIKEVILFPTLRPVCQTVKPAVQKQTMMAVAVLNQGAKMSGWQLMNTVAHLNASFAGRLGKELFVQDTIKTKDGQDIRLNIEQAIMIKTAKSDQEIISLINKSKALDLDVTEFIRPMLETSDDKKIIDWAKERNFSDVEFLGVLIFGPLNSIKKLTKDLKLFK